MKYRIDQREDSPSLPVSRHFRILAIQNSGRETHLFSFFSPCAYLHLSPLLRSRAFRKAQGVLTKICSL